MHRKLRIAWSVAWGVVAVLLCVLWLRSYGQVLGGAFPFGSRMVGFFTTRGSVSIETNVIDVEPVGYASYDPDAGQIHNWHYSGFAYEQDPFHNVTLVPLWFGVLFTATIATVPWLRWRFSLRTLLVATTLIAVVLGLVVWAVGGGK